VWNARIDHLTLRVREAMRRDEHLKAEADLGKTVPESHVPLIATELLMMLRIVDQDGVIESFQRKVLNAMRNEKRANPERTTRQRMLSGISLAVLSAFRERSEDTGLSSEVILVCCNAIFQLLSRRRLLPELQAEIEGGANGTEPL
jgi:hypothetical protein